LEYAAIKNGTAIKRAKSDYDKQYKNKAIIDSIPKAWEKLLQDKDSTLLSLLSEKVADLCGNEPSEETVFNFLSSLSQGNEGGPDPVLDVDTPDPTAPPLRFRGVKCNNVITETRNASRTLEALLKLAINKFPNSISNIESQTTRRSRSLYFKAEIKTLHRQTRFNRQVLKAVTKWVVAWNKLW
jgi:hypothetical protein